jgi:hypothetical protein
MLSGFCILWILCDLFPININYGAKDQREIAYSGE